MTRARQRRLRAVGAQQLRPEFGEIHFLRVEGFFGVFAQDHGPREVLDGLFDHVGEHGHHGDGLVVGETFGFEALDEFEGVEVVVAVGGRGCGEGAAVVERAGMGMGRADGGGGMTMMEEELSWSGDVDDGARACLGLGRCALLLGVGGAVSSVGDGRGRRRRGLDGKCPERSNSTSGPCQLREQEARDMRHGR